MSYAPFLTEDQIDRIRVYATPRQITPGEILYQPGFDTPPVYVVLSGAIRIVAVGGKEDRTVTTYRAGQFSGELLMISGRRSIYRCEAVEPGLLLEVCSGNVKRVASAVGEGSIVLHLVHQALAGP